MGYKSHECVIGLIHQDECDNLVTLSELKNHIKNEIEFFYTKNKVSAYYFIGNIQRPYLLKDYCDKRKSTDLTRFDYCPCCGERINWKEFKENKNETL